MRKFLKYCGIAYISIGAVLGLILYASYVFAYWVYTPGWAGLRLGYSLELSALVRGVTWAPSLAIWARNPHGYSFGKWLAPGLYAEVVDPSAQARPERDRPDVEAKEVFGAFEFICLEQLRSQDRIPELLETVGAVELPANQAATFLVPQAGRAWMMRPTGEAANPFIIALSDTAVCSVMAPKAKAGPILAHFQEHTRNSKIGEEKIGSQIERVFAVSHDDQFRDGDAHAMVMISTSHLLEGIIINAIPEAALAEVGTRPPRWPR